MYNVIGGGRAKERTPGRQAGSRQFGSPAARGAVGVADNRTKSAIILEGTLCAGESFRGLAQMAFSSHPQMPDSACGCPKGCRCLTAWEEGCSCTDSRTENDRAVTRINLWFSREKSF